MKILLFTMLLSVLQAAPPVPRQTPNSAARGGQAVKKNPANNQKPASPPLVKNPTTAEKDKNASNEPTKADTQKTVVIREPVSVSVASMPKKDWWDRAYVIFTGLLVIIGSFGVFAALRTLGAVKRQADITQKTLVLTQRPRIVVRNLYFLKDEADRIAYGIQEGSNCLGQFYIANCGGTSAHIQERYSIVWVTSQVGRLPAKRPYEGVVGVQNKKTLAPGESTTDFFSMRDGSLWPDTPLKLATGSATLYVLGWVGYTDDLSIYRRTEFCRKYDPEKDRFIPIDDADYEHAD